MEVKVKVHQPVQEQHEEHDNSRKSSSQSQEQKSRNTSNSEIKMTLNEYLESVNLKRRISSRSKDKKRPLSSANCNNSNNFINSNNTNININFNETHHPQQPSYLEPPPLPTTNPTLEYHKLNQEWKSRKLFSTWIIELKELCREYIKRDDEYVEVIRLIEKISEFVKGEIETIKRDNLLLESFLVMEASYWVEGEVGNIGDGENNVDGNININSGVNINNNNNINNNDRLSNYIKAVLSSRSDCYSQYNNTPLRTAKSIQEQLANEQKISQNQIHTNNNINKHITNENPMLCSPERTTNNFNEQSIPTTNKKNDYKTSTEPKSTRNYTRQQEEQSNQELNKNNNMVTRFSSSSTAGKMHYTINNNKDNNNKDSINNNTNIESQTSINDNKSNKNYNNNNNIFNNNKINETNIGSIKQLNINNTKINKSLESTNRLNKHYIYSFNDKHNNVNNTLRTNNKHEQPNINIKPFVEQSNNHNHHNEASNNNSTANKYDNINVQEEEEEYYEVGLLKINSRNYNLDSNNNADDVPRLSLMSRYDVGKGENNSKRDLFEEGSGNNNNNVDNMRVRFDVDVGGNCNKSNNRNINNINNKNINNMNNNNISNKQPPLRERKQKPFNNKLSTPESEQHNHFEMVQIAGGGREDNCENNNFNLNNNYQNHRVVEMEQHERQIPHSIKVETKYNNNENNNYTKNSLHSTPSITKHSPHIVSIETPSTLRRRYPSFEQHNTINQTERLTNLEPDCCEFKEEESYHISVRNPQQNVESFRYEHRNRNNYMNKSSIIVQNAENHNSNHNNHQEKATTITASTRRENIMSRYDNFKQVNNNN